MPPCSGARACCPVKRRAVIGHLDPGAAGISFADLQARESPRMSSKCNAVSGRPSMMYSDAVPSPRSEDEGNRFSFLLESKTSRKWNWSSWKATEGFSKAQSCLGKRDDPEIEKDRAHPGPHKMNGEGHYLALFRQKRAKPFLMRQKKNRSKRLKNIKTEKNRK